MEEDRGGRGAVRAALGTAAVAWALALGGVVTATPRGGGPSNIVQPPADVAPGVEAALVTRPTVDVIVLLRDGTPPDAPIDALRAGATAARAALLAGVTPAHLRVRTVYDVLPIVAGSVTPDGLALLRRLPVVRAVERDTVLAPIAIVPQRGDAERGRGRGEPLAEAVPLVGADYVHSELGITGKGITVAVLDTGIDRSHRDFEGKIVEQYCYSSSRSCAPTNVVENANAQDEAGHGTAVSGIIASKGVVSSVGVAPDANLVAVRVFQDAGGAQTSDIIKGLDFVLVKQLPHNVRVVNMSLGGGSGRGTNCDDQNTAMKEAFRRLVARNVAIFVATGNNGFPSEVSSPACISNSTAVGATYDVEAPTGGAYCPGQLLVTPLTIACFTNRGRAMDVLAPGIFIASSALGGGVTKPGAGTSYASPMAAGVAALMLQADPSLRPSAVERIMQETGDDVKHLENRDVFKLVNARRAVEQVLRGAPASPTPSRTPSPTASRTPTPSATPTASPTNVAPAATTVAPSPSLPATATPSPSPSAPGPSGTPASTSITPALPTLTPPESRLTIYLPVARRQSQ